MDNRTFAEKTSDNIAAFGGSWTGIFLGAAILVLWVLWNTLTPFAFDSYPFIFMNLFLSMVAAFQAPVILMAQQRAERKQDEAYVSFFCEIRRLVKKDIVLEKKILKLLESRPTIMGNEDATPRSTDAEQ